MVALRKYAVDKAGFVSSVIFRIAHVLGLAFTGDTVSQRARYFLGLHFLASALILFL